MFFLDVLDLWATVCAIVAIVAMGIAYRALRRAPARTREQVLNEVPSWSFLHPDNLPHGRYKDGIG